jgi:putative Mn2+ efflux pump MntP
MGLPEIVLIAFGLSMDAFAVSIALGLSARRAGIKEMLVPGVFFGFFQALMPLAGYFAGFFFAGKIQKADHWIAFVLLGLIGGKMILDSLVKKDREDETNGYSFRFAKMLVLAIATSIDALAIGITFALFRVNIFTTITITGLTTFFISICGVKIGSLFGTKFRARAEFLGGAVLVLLGIKIVVEHIVSGYTP